jgi:hypothetical protein
MVNSVHEWYRPGRRTNSRRAIIDATVSIALNGLRRR